MKILPACIRLILLLTVFIVSGCRIENGESPELPDGVSQTSLSKAALESFLTAIEGEYIPLYSSDGQYSGMSLHLSGNKLTTCNTHIYKTLDACVSSGGQTNYAEVEFFDVAAGGACVGGQKLSAMIMGVESTDSICVFLDERTMKPIDASPEARGSAVLKEGYLRGFLLPAGTPVHITTLTSTDGKLSRFFHLFEAQELPSDFEEPGYPGPMPPEPSASVARPLDTSGSTSGTNKEEDNAEPHCPGNVNEFRSFVDGFRKNTDGIQKEFTSSVVSYFDTSRGGDEVFEDWLVENMEFPIMRTSDALLDANVLVEFPDDYQLGLVREFGPGNEKFREFGFERTEHCWYLVTIRDGQAHVQD